MKHINLICTLLLDEVERAEKKHPNWPTDPVHGAAIMCEEAGEAIQAALDLYYKRGDLKQLRLEVIQTGAMAMRFLEHLEDVR